MPNKTITIMPTKGAIRYREKLAYFEYLINTLYKEDGYLLPIFLLRCQLVEFSLKYLLINHPYKPRSYQKDMIEGLTMGQSIGKLRDLEDEYMKNIIKKASILVDCRNAVTHNFIKSNNGLDQIEKDIKKNMKHAKAIEENIYYYFDFVEKHLRGL